ncbi:hypothetical protein EVAR_63637_1 [Eumeta japonica]|uniref:Uncharacterized protein n=1 Tax=Eumeta variegata TaxID=151549 RepID=A0A4C2A1C4_EUMVA|nr:hypothetical protein EVAR_63637_1 [Eumeta japonica]
MVVVKSEGRPGEFRSPHEAGRAAGRRKLPKNLPDYTSASLPLTNITNCDCVQRLSFNISTGNRRLRSLVCLLLFNFPLSAPYFNYTTSFAERLRSVDEELVSFLSSRPVSAARYGPLKLLLSVPPSMLPVEKVLKPCLL